MKLFTRFVLLQLLCLPSIAFPSTMAICKIASEEMNKTLPYKKDKITTIINTGCVATKQKVRFLHILEIHSVPLDRVKTINFKKDMKPSVLNTYCSDPEVRVFLEAFDVEFRYYMPDGVFIGSFSMQSSECGQK